MIFHSDTSKWQKIRHFFFLKYLEILILFFICYVIILPIIFLKKKKIFNTKSRKNVLLYGAYGNLSVGDDAILLSIVNYFRKNLQNFNLVVSSYRPDDTIQKFGVNSILQGRTLDGIVTLFNNRKKYDTVIFGGGGIIETHNYGFKSIIGTLNKIAKFSFAILQNKEVVFLGIGTNITEYPFSQRILLKQVFRHAQFISTRDSGSYNAINRINPHAALHSCADPALMLGEPRMEITQIKPLNAIAINIMPYHRLVGDAEIMKQQRQKLSDVLDQLIVQFDTEVHFYPMVSGDDTDEQTEIIKLIKHKEKVKEFKPIYSPEEFMDDISVYPLFIGTRLHANILAFNANVPILGLAYHSKIDNLFKIIGNKDFISFPLLNFNTQELIKAIKKILDNNQEMKKRVVEIKGRVIPLAKSNFNEFQ